MAVVTLVTQASQVLVDNLDWVLVVNQVIVANLGFLDRQVLVALWPIGAHFLTQLTSQIRQVWVATTFLS